MPGEQRLQWAPEGRATARVFGFCCPNGMLWTLKHGNRCALSPSALGEVSEY